jgi:hypothetical protein
MTEKVEEAGQKGGQQDEVKEKSVSEGSGIKKSTSRLNIPTEIIKPPITSL